MTAEESMSFEMAIVALVPEAEGLVRPFRERYDPSAVQGMPAHITISYPFLPVASVSADVIYELGQYFKGYPCFDFALVSIARFPDVLYLVPDRVGRFKDLIEGVWDRYPEAPPYGGLYAEIVPHLTIAQVDDQLQLEQIQIEFTQAAEGQLPIKSKVDAVWLMDNREGDWKPRISFGLSR